MYIYNLNFYFRILWKYRSNHFHCTTCSKFYFERK